MVVRVSIREMAPTVFVCVEDATGTPPCCLRNESGVPVWFAVIPPEARAFASLAAAGHSTLALARGERASAFKLPGRGHHGRHNAVVWHLLPPGDKDVPLLWDFHKMANDRKVRVSGGGV
jgi:hypothetical protein